ncbi:hypothetical protein DRN97_00040 [Methanosarcinales archaeon]|nr:MAG: hypothetical protein DRN97_00040 [Methanosarcinales archaeon]
MGRKIVEVVIGTVEVESGPGPGPGPGPSPSVIDSFIEEHRKLKNILDRYGAQGMCVPRSALERESGIKGERLDKHIEVFQAHSAISEVDGDILCGREALSKLKEKIKLEL